ncbi:patatin-like phospholipase family protein [Melittangium boletus]|uniref:Patatin n=1 Tax=Melittangium boletus DSM 14713 TaxID=1294270 RepID=A0A250IRI5_9BACT|nr:patatin-like phospholipase family protein [Melittangium boletus]ATB33546.1 patatin [Melittangium boletus DSM 14713]
MRSHRVSRVASAVLLFQLTSGPVARAAGEAPPAEETPTAPEVPGGTEFLPGNIENPALAQALALATQRSAPVLVVSGGISLGAYQAGFLSTLVRFWSVARREGKPGQLGDPMPRVWTGASAGAVNALLGGLASCDTAFEAPQWSPEASLFWRVWIDKLDLAHLLPEEDQNRGDHLFNDAYMKETLQVISEETGRARFRDDCSFALGLTATNLVGRDVPFGSGWPESRASLKRVTEKIVVQVMTHGAQKPTVRLPFLQGTPDVAPPYIQVQRDELRFYPALGAELPPRTTGGQSVGLDTLLRAPQASGAFPFAFSPVDVSVSFFDEVRWSPLQSLKLVDGGVLNNNPLDLAVRLGRRWVERVEPRAQTLDTSRFPIVYLDQDVVDWRWAPPLARDEKLISPLESTYLQHLGNLLAASQDSVVLDTLEHDPTLSGRIKIPRRGAVLPSEFRFAMMGFFDRRFREHDFYRGMHDAIRFLSTQFSTTRTVEALVPSSGMELPWDREARIRHALGISSEKFRCVEDGACEASEELIELGRLRRASDKLTHLARTGRLREDDVDELLTTLKDEGYRYSPGVMSEAPATGTRADFMPVRERVGRAFHDLVTQQQGALRLILRPAGSTFLDKWLTYTPPRNALTFHLSRQHGVGLGWEAPVISFEDRGVDNVYDRSEWRLGVALSGFGVRDMDQLVPNETRLRWATLGAYADWVSDLDGFSGNIRLLELGPYVRWRMGVGASGSYLRGPEEWSLLLPEVRFGLDLSEVVGVRVAVPLYMLNKPQGGPFQAGQPKFFKETSVGVEVLLTHW